MLETKKIKAKPVNGTLWLAMLRTIKRRFGDLGIVRAQLREEILTEPLGSLRGGLNATTEEIPIYDEDMDECPLVKRTTKNWVARPQLGPTQ